MNLKNQVPHSESLTARIFEFSRFQLHVDACFRGEKEIDKIRPFVFLPRVRAESANPSMLSKRRY